jgi:hypothetical protein
VLFLGNSKLSFLLTVVNDRCVRCLEIFSRRISGQEAVSCGFCLVCTHCFDSVPSSSSFFFQIITLPPLISLWLHGWVSMCRNLTQNLCTFLHNYFSQYCSQYSNWLQAGPKGRSSSPSRSRMFTSTYRSHQLWGPPGPRSNGAPSPMVKQQGCESDHTPLTSAEIKITLICTSTSQYIFMM